MKSMKIESPFDGLLLDVAIIEPAGTPQGIIQFSHGMSEHKERYFDFMEFLASAGFVCVIHDHRGHGESVKEPGVFGDFYTGDTESIIGDLHTVIDTMKELYPDLPTYLFSHSMGTLVARGYMKKYDWEIDKLVLCGPPTRNKMAGMGLLLSRFFYLFDKSSKPNKLLNDIAFSGADNSFGPGESWLSANKDNAIAYAEDPLCGFTFATSGFVNLTRMMKEDYEKKGYRMGNPDLPILLIAGEDDPIIQSPAMFQDTIKFLKGLGYSKVYGRLYEGLRHEILNEKENMKVYRDVLSFFAK